MFSQLSRSAVALALVLSLTAGSVAVAQQQPTAQAPQAESKEARKEREKQEKEEREKKELAEWEARRKIEAAANAQKTAGKPLSSDENPALIGKRKLNSGLFAKMSMSTEKEVAMGRQLSAEIDRQAKLIDDPIITEYINRVGQNVVLHSDAKIPFTIKVVDSDEVNAFALPGGFFYVNKGLILAADSEAEVAGVMAHEIAHVTARHAVETQAKGMLAQVGLIAGSIFLGGIPGAILQNGAGFGLGAGFAKFSTPSARPTSWASSISTPPATIRARCPPCSRSWPRRTRRSPASSPRPSARTRSRLTGSKRRRLWSRASPNARSTSSPLRSSSA
jgi:hypothetical protein